MNSTMPCNGCKSCCSKICNKTACRICNSSPCKATCSRCKSSHWAKGGFGGFGGFGEAPLVEDNQAEQLRKTMNETIKNFDKSIDEAQDEETKKSLRAARDNYKKATEEEIEKLAQNEPQRPAQPQMQPFNFAPVPMNGADPFGLFAPNLTQQKPRLGVMLLPVPEGMAGQLKLKEDQGVVVNRVLPGSVAEKAGLERFDIILEFAGKPVASNVQAFVDSVNTAQGRRRSRDCRSPQWRAQNAQGDRPGQGGTCRGPTPAVEAVPRAENDDPIGNGGTAG